jgi:hypothetical protein
MVAHRKSIEKVHPQNDRVPEALNEGAAMVQRLVACGTMKQIEEHVKVQRQGGYSGVDAVLYMVLFFTAMPVGGVRGLWLLCSGVCERVGALAGRSALMSSSACSRMFTTLRMDEVRAFSWRLLVDLSGVVEVMRDSAVQFTDGLGRQFHVFAFDPVRIATRRRGLPEDHDLPDPVRRHKALAAPGRTGRKRGELALSVGVLEHRGSGAIVDMTIGAGNGDGRVMFREMLLSTALTLDCIGAGRSDGVMVSDGEFGSIPHLHECDAMGIRYLSRCSRYEVLRDPLVVARLVEGAWFRVDDSGSGPTRYACDIGVVEAHAGKMTRADDGTPYDPVQCRLVASAYRSDPAASGAGIQVGDFRVELYWALGMEPEAFAANDVVTLFYGRCGQEVAFASHKCRLGLHRVFSRQLPGQLMAMICGAFVWNLRIAAAVEISKELPAPKKAGRRTSSPAAGSSNEDIRAAIRYAQLALTDSDSDEVVTLVAESPHTPVDSHSEPSAESETTSDDCGAPCAAALHAGLGAYDWPRLLSSRHGWSFDPQTWEVVTADGHRLRYSSRERSKNGWKLRFRSTDASANRGASFAVRTTPSGAPDPRPPKEHPQRRHGIRLVQPGVDGPLPPRDIGWPCFVVAAATRLLPDLVRGVEFRVSVHRRRTVEAHPLMAGSRRERQHWRLSWAERVARKAATARVRIRIADPADIVRRWIEPHRAT